MHASMHWKANWKNAKTHNTTKNGKKRPSGAFFFRKICIYHFFVVLLHPILEPRTDLTACNLVKTMLKRVIHEHKQSLVDFFLELQQ